MAVPNFILVKSTTMERVWSKIKKLLLNGLSLQPRKETTIRWSI